LVRSGAYSHAVAHYFTDHDDLEAGLNPLDESGTNYHPEFDDVGKIMFSAFGPLHTFLHARTLALVRRDEA
jgi:hypothetical protein